VVTRTVSSVRTQDEWGLGGFQPLGTPSSWSDLPGVRTCCCDAPRGGRLAGGLSPDLWLRAYDRFASDVQRLCPTGPRAALAMLLIGRDCAHAPGNSRPRPKIWPLASPAYGVAGRPPVTTRSRPVRS